MASFLFDLPYNIPENTPEPNMTTTRKELVRKIKKKSDESDERDKRNNGSWHYYLEINEICGISVDVELVRNHNGLSILITPFNVWLYDKKKLIVVHSIIVKNPILYRKTYFKKEETEERIKYTLDDFNRVLEEIDNDIVNMKFNKLEGVFYTSDNLHPMQAPPVRSYEENINQLGCDHDHPEECCVCLDTTKTTTPCGHKLCVMCWDKIKKNVRELPCPMCRANLRNRKAVQHIYPEGWVGPDDHDDDNRVRNGEQEGVYHEDDEDVVDEGELMFIF